MTGTKSEASSIRAAGATDAEALSALAISTYTEAFGHSLTAEDLRAHVEAALTVEAFTRILAADVVLVAIREGRIVGFVQVGAAREEAPVEGGIEIRRLYVDGVHRDLGIGTELMNAALAHPIFEQASAAFLDVWDQNEGARRFYARHGFRDFGTRAFVVASGAETTPDIIMVRDLR